MIPKIIHYCWFGKKNKPTKIQKCIDSWRSVLNDYQFVEWNEDNFDVNSSEYAKQAYSEGKYAFVSDIARIEALYQYGGIYMDTDVEVYKTFDDLLNESRVILGFEYDNWVATSFMAAEKEHPFLKEFADLYIKETFSKADGTINTTTNVSRLTKLLCEKGLEQENRKQELPDGIVVYPIEFFSPYDYANCIMEKTEKSYCAHLFFVTWLPKIEQIKKFIKRTLVRFIGKRRLRKFIKFIKREQK